MWGNLKKMLMLACLSLGAYTTYLMVNDNAQKLLDTYSDVQKLELHRLDNITTSERSNGETYVSIMRNNLDLIKKELYQ